MEGNTALLDTPKKKLLQSESACLRAALKDFEHNFAAQHHGRKPSKDDIKADGVVARKYKEYNKIRDVLAGKIDISTLDASSPLKRKKPRARSEAVLGISPAKQKAQSTPHGKRLRPDDLDPYDAPSSVTPRRVLSTIGPTPQRDGQALGIFDLLSNPGSGKSMQATPSGRKRKIGTLFGADDDIENQPVITQTPSQRSSKEQRDLLDHLAGTPISQLKTSRHKHSRTPISDGKKFMLSQFFTTPSAVRYVSVGESQRQEPVEAAFIDPTPLRTQVLGLSPARPSLPENPDATPAYLRRSYSFKDRLLSASATHSRDNSSDIDSNSPTSVRTGPRRRSAKQVKFKPKLLSQIAAEMRKQEDEKHDDDLDAMREMEMVETEVQVGDSQPVDLRGVGGTAEQVEPKIWKKKGQKRTTRRVIMRPSNVRIRDEQNFVAPEEEDEEEDQLDGETFKDQYANGQSPEDEPHALAKYNNDRDDDDDVFNEQGEEGYDDLYDDAQQLHRSKAKPKTNVQKPKPFKPAKSTGEEPLGKPPKSKAKETKKSGTINPNAHSHMNFRSLKIKNKNSKAKGRGRGRFGRR